MATSDENDEGVPEFAGDERDPRWQLLRPREWRTYTRYHFLLAKFLFFGGIAFVAYWVLSSIGAVLFPVLISLIIAYLFDPLVDWFEERGINRSVGILFVILGGLVFGLLFALILYPTIVAQIRNVVDRFPRLLELIQTQTIPWIEREFGYEIPSTIDEGLKKYGESIGEYLPGIADQVGAWARGIVLSTGAVVAALINLVTIPVFSFYFLRDFDRIRLKLVEYLPDHRRNYVLTRAREMDQVVGDWVRGQLQVASILAVLYAIGLIFPFSACGLSVRAAVAVGVLTGLLNFIPYFGVAVGIVLSVLMVVINWAGFGPLAGVIGVFAGVQTLEGYLITPRIVGEKVGMSPVTVIIVLLIGGELLGLFGILIAVPVFGAFKVLIPDIVDYYKGTPFFTGRKLVPDEIGSRKAIRDRDREVEPREGVQGEASGEKKAGSTTQDSSDETEEESDDDPEEREEGEGRGGEET